MLAGILEKRAAGPGHLAEVNSDIEGACLREIGLPLSIIRSSSPEQMQELMAQGGGRHVRSILLAELLLQDAESNRLAGKLPNAIRSELQAFCLLGESIGFLSPDDAAVYRPKLERLAKELSAVGDSPYLADKLRKYGFAGVM